MANTTAPKAPASRAAKAAAPFLLLALLLALTGCAQHDGMYNDAAALAGEDRYSTVTFTARETTPGVYEGKTSKHSGAYTLWRYTAQLGEQLSFYCTVGETAGGDAKLVLVSPGGSVTTLAEASAGASAYSAGFEASQPGEYAIKLVGRKNAAAEFHVEELEGKGGFG